MPSTPVPPPQESRIGDGNSSQIEQLITNEPTTTVHEKHQSIGEVAHNVSQTNPISMESEIRHGRPTSNYPHVSTSMTSESIEYQRQIQQQHHHQTQASTSEESKGDNHQQQQFNITSFAGSTNNPPSAGNDEITITSSSSGTASTSTSITATSNSNSSSDSALNDEAQGKDNRKKRKKFNEACSECRRAHKACSRTRPCDRCTRLGIPHKCQSMERKKRKVTKKRWFNYQVKEDGRIAVENPQITSIKEERQAKRRSSISFVNQTFPGQSMPPGMTAATRTNTGSSTNNEMNQAITLTLQYHPYYQTPATTSGSLEPTITQAQQFTQQQQQPKQRQYQFTDHSFGQQQAYYIPTGNISNISGSSDNRMNFSASYPRGISGVMESSDLALQHLSNPSSGIHGSSQPHIFVMKTNNHQMDNTTATIDSKQSEMMTPQQQQSSYLYHQSNPMTLPSFNQLTGNPTYTMTTQSRQAPGITTAHHQQQQQQPSFQSWTAGYQHQRGPTTGQWMSTFDTHQQLQPLPQQQQQPQQPFHNYEPYLSFIASPSNSSTGGLNSLEDQSEWANQNQQKHRK